MLYRAAIIEVSSREVLTAYTRSASTPGFSLQISSISIPYRLDMPHIVSPRWT